MPAEITFNVEDTLYTHRVAFIDAISTGNKVAIANAAVDMIKEISAFSLDDQPELKEFLKNNSPITAKNIGSMPAIDTENTPNAKRYYKVLACIQNPNLGNVIAVARKAEAYEYASSMYHAVEDWSRSEGKRGVTFTENYYQDTLSTLKPKTLTLNNLKIKEIEIEFNELAAKIQSYHECTLDQAKALALAYNQSGVLGITDTVNAITPTTTNKSDVNITKNETGNLKLEFTCPYSGEADAEISGGQFNITVDIPHDYRFTSANYLQGTTCTAKLEVQGKSDMQALKNAIAEKIKEVSKYKPFISEMFTTPIRSTKELIQAKLAKAETQTPRAPSSTPHLASKSQAQLIE